MIGLRYSCFAHSYIIRSRPHDLRSGLNVPIAVRMRSGFDPVHDSDDEFGVPNCQLDCCGRNVSPEQHEDEKESSHGNVGPKLIMSGDVWVTSCWKNKAA